MRFMPNLLLNTWFALIILSASAYTIPGSHQPDPPNGHWVDTWTAMPQLTESTNLPPPPFNTTTSMFYNTTLRQTIKVTTPASQVRLQISNAFSNVDLPITAATIALPIAYPGQNLTGSSGINTITLQTVTFSGSHSMVIPPGALAVSDPIALPVHANQIISISLYLAQGQASQSIISHPGSRTTSWLSFGNHIGSANITSPSTTSLAHWYFISALEAWQPRDYSSLAIIGDSITDGRGSDTNANNRWPDLLFDRLQDSDFRHIAIANQAAGGNRVLEDGLGPSALSRVERDVLSHPGVKYAMIFEGVNDIGSADATVANQTDTGDRLIQAYQQIITRIHTSGIPVFGATITPFGCTNSTLQPYSDPLREKTRLRINEWIRRSGKFDAVVDFDKVVRDPKNSTQLNPKFNSGDCLHPNVNGYKAMAAAFPLEVFREWEHGVSGFM